MKNRKPLAVILLMAMLFTSMSFAAFADDTPDSPDISDEFTAEEVEITDETTNINENAEDISEETAVEEIGTVSPVYYSISDAVPVVSISGNTATVSWSDADIEGAVTVNAYLQGSEEPYKTVTVTGVTQAVIEDLAYNKTYEFAIAGEDGTESQRTAAITLGIPVVKDLKAYPGHQSVSIRWTPVKGVDKYAIYRKESSAKAYTKIATVNPDFTNDQQEYKNGTDFDKINAAKNVTYNYMVRAVVDGVESDNSNISSAARVRTIQYEMTFKAAVKLKSHDKAKKAVTFKKGQTITAEGYGTGAYKFNYKRRPYEAKWFRMKKGKCVYKKNAYGTAVDNVTAENYVNEGKYSSKTDYLVWISLYSQRVFVFKGSKGKWECIKSWQCNSGKAMSPTPSGTSKSVWATFAKRSKHKFWSCFSSYNAIHGRNNGDAKLGKPVSNGCVRIANENAKWLMNINKSYLSKNKKNQTKVIVF